MACKAAERLRSKRRKYFCACERIWTAVLVATSRSMAFHSRPYMARACRKRLCSSSVQYSRRLVRTYFLRVVLVGSTALGSLMESFKELTALSGDDDDDGSEVNGVEGMEERSWAEGTGCAEAGPVEVTPGALDDIMFTDLLTH